MSLLCLSVGPTRYRTTSVTSNPFSAWPVPTQPRLVWSSVFSALVTYLPAALILTSYGLVLLAIGRMRSAAGKEKALSTCASHFLAIAIFYSTVIFTYVQPHGPTDDTSGQVGCLSVTPS